MERVVHLEFEGWRIPHDCNNDAVTRLQDLVWHDAAFNSLLFIRKTDYLHHRVERYDAVSFSQ
jgi:hypothetical protein